LASENDSFESEIVKNENDAINSDFSENEAKDYKVLWQFRPLPREWEERLVHG
jgi:hypothetical protein